MDTQKEEKAIKRDEQKHMPIKDKIEYDKEQYQIHKEQINERTEEIKKQISEKKSTYSFRKIFHAAFNLNVDQAGYEEISERIESGVELRGTNMCILILAIFIASVGLNMNSTAVIIGAMLVSPLMGPIMGIGFSIAIYDSNMLKKSVTVLLFEVVVALAASTIYFMVSPITAPSSELLARTSPTVWDVIIAICGGLAGMIGTTRKEKSNIIPGVAIATALMPPLCTAGYGLAVGNIRYFGGAMYLFSINGVFIAISTMLIAVFMRLPSKQNANAETRKNIFKRVMIVAIVAIVPSGFFAAEIVRESVFQGNVNSYIENEFQFDNTQVVKYELDDENKQLNVALIGAALNENEIAKLEQVMKEYNIDNLSLNVRQTEVASGVTPEELEEYVKSETSRLNASNEEDYQELQSQLIAAKSELSQYQDKAIDVTALKDEIEALYPEVTQIHAGYLSDDKAEQMTVVIEVTKPLSKDSMQTLKNWLEKRLVVENAMLYQCVEGVLYPMEIEVKDLDETEEPENAETEAADSKTAEQSSSEKSSEE